MDADDRPTAREGHHWLMTELKADWCRVQKLLGRSRDKAGNLMPGWIIVQCRPSYVITRQLASWAKLSKSPSCESVTALSGPLKVASPASRPLRSPSDPAPQPRLRLRRGRRLILRPTSLHARPRQSRRVVTSRAGLNLERSDFAEYIEFLSFSHGNNHRNSIPAYQEPDTKKTP